MKISKSLLKSILVGVTVTGATIYTIDKCTTPDLRCDETCTVDCDRNHKDKKRALDPCPTCGMG